MYSFANYKDQCYNIGSPSPSPNNSPLKYLPTTSEEFDFSPVKEPYNAPEKNKSTQKRKYSCDSDCDSPQKRQRMLTKEEMQELLQNNNAQMQEALNKIDKKLDEKMDQGFNVLKNSLCQLETKMEINNTNMENRMSKLENEFNIFQEATRKVADETKEELKESIIPSIEGLIPKVKEDIKKEVFDATVGAWKVTIASFWVSDK